MLFAKQPGRTSFSSLSTIKKALGTSKVGHTGTLDSFADGLLVVLVGSLTRLVPHITGFDKTYLALVEFGSETDTLDPTGTVIKTAPLPSEEDVRAVLPQFTGDIMQVPPAFSALHVDGKRASDLMRRGETVELPARPLHIYHLNLLDFKGKYALLEVRCSKGTYIRALARDIAHACGSCAHLAALRRVAVGPFSLSEAAGCSKLSDFTISVLTTAAPDSPTALSEQTEATSCDTPAFLDEVRAALQPMTATLASYCGFTPIMLSEAGVQAFTNGRPLKKTHFYWPKASATTEASSAENAELAVFAPSHLIASQANVSAGLPQETSAHESTFCGIIKKEGTRLSYGFVIPQKPAFAVYSWEQITSGRFNEAWKKQGTALTIGSFDGPHFGHESLFATVCAQKHLVPGVITFSRSLRGLKNPVGYAGDVATLSTRLAAFQKKGFAFAVVIDFTTEFAHLSGTDFLSVLLTKCGMSFLSEGNDFHFGYKGEADVAALMNLSKTHSFDFAAIAPILHKKAKISSSRIRECLLLGDVAEANTMLNHSFTLDCAGWLWTCTESDLSAPSPRGNLSPKDGTYSVSVRIFCTSSSTAAHSTFCTEQALCTISEGYVHLSFKSQQPSGCILSVAFLNPTPL